MNAEQFAAIEQRAQAATDGPWIAEYSGEQGNCVIPHDAQSTREAVCVTRLYDQTADAEFIAHARQDIPALLDEIRNLREECRLADLDAKVNAATADRAEQAVERVRELHQMRRGMWGDGCRSCGRNLPCPTLEALDPQEES